MLTLDCEKFGCFPFTPAGILLELTVLLGILDLRACLTASSCFSKCEDNLLRETDSSLPSSGCLPVAVIISNKLSISDICRQLISTCDISD
uniref:Secreted protein n=1 Tax=Schistosoma curassoni TaxID=6186 RepID=A0A183JQP4_9TREM